MICFFLVLDQELQLRVIGLWTRTSSFRLGMRILHPPSQPAARQTDSQTDRSIDTVEGRKPDRDP